MSPFTLFFARLTELLGAEISTQLVREFAGQAIQFPITSHYGIKVQRVVTKRLTVYVNAAEYDVSHLPEAAVGDVIAVDPASLTPLDHGRLAFGARLLHVNGRDEEKNQTTPDLQAQSLARAQAPLGHLDEEANPHLHASAPEAFVNQAPSGAQASQPLPEMQSEGLPIDPANVDRS